jgi:hypothetical protein
MNSVLKFNCPHCGKRLSVTLDQVEVFAPCPSCLRRIRAKGCLPSGPPPPPKDRKLPAPQKSATHIPATGQSRPSRSSIQSTASRSARPPGDLNPQPMELGARRRFLQWLTPSRSFVVSALLHLALVLMGGSVVLFQQSKDAPDFVAGNDGFLVDPGQTAAPPDDPLSQPQQAPQTPASSTAAAPLSALVTTALAPRWQANAQMAPIRGISDSAKSAMASLETKLARGGAGGAMGKLGGTRMAMIFGKKVQANRLGVILDVSGSAHPHLAGAIEEIQKGFADATLILYPGCGLTEVKGASGQVIRKYSTITSKELVADPSGFTTAGFLVDALKIREFAEMVKRPSLRETLFVSWYEEKGADGKPEGDFEKLVGQTQLAFAELLKRRVDAIYWFSDFQDKVSPQMVDKLTSELMLKRVRLYLHNFAGPNIRPMLTEMAEKTGGTVDADKP